MDTPSAFRPSRPPRRAVLIVAAVATFALAGCSSSDSTSSSSETTAPASENEATNDVVASSDVSLTIEFDQEALEQLYEDGSRVLVAKEIDTTPGGAPTQVAWVAVNPLETNSITFDPADMQVFASETELEAGALLEELATAEVAVGETATWNPDGTFQVTTGSGDSDAVTVMSGSSPGGPGVFGLAGMATVDGTPTSAPYVAAAGFPDQLLEFTDTGRILVWVSNAFTDPGTIVGQTPPNAFTVDTTAQPNATLSYDLQTGTFVLAS